MAEENIKRGRRVHGVMGEQILHHNYTTCLMFLSERLMECLKDDIIENMLISFLAKS